MRYLHSRIWREKSRIALPHAPQVPRTSLHDEQLADDRKRLLSNANDCCPSPLPAANDGAPERQGHVLHIPILVADGSR